MKNRDVRLNRLFDTARLALPAGEPRSMPLHLKRRVLSRWRAGGGAVDERGPGLAWVFRGALACSALVMLATIAWSFAEQTEDPSDDLAIANYELRVDVMP